MLKLDAKFPKDLESFNIVGELNGLLQSFSNEIDKKLLASFQAEYGLKKRYYNKIRKMEKKANEHTFLSSEGHVGLWRLIESPLEATSQKGVKRRDRKPVRIIRGRHQGTLSRCHFKAKKGAHARKDKWFLKIPESLHDFFSEQADVITERTLHE